jgi:hypothetical protein
MKVFKTISRVCIYILFLATSYYSQAQDSCTIRLRLIDTFGDGWDDSQLYIKLGNNAERAYTHDGAGGVRADSIRLYELRAKPGDSLIIRYDPQEDSQDEIFFSVLNNANEPIIARGPSPAGGVIYRGLVKCVACGSPLNTAVASIRAFSATVNWKPSAAGIRPTYRIEWDTMSFTPGTRTAKNVFSTTDTFVILQGLKEVTRYNVYVSTQCFPATDTSNWVGPFTFRTDTASNAGISDIFDPFNRCGLGLDSVKVKIKNYAGAPISLIPFKYSVNNVVQAVSMPSDGLYTGVISKDSTASIAFKALYNFAPGEYTIAAWTELKDDKNPKNDTFRLTFTSPRTIQTLPYQQGFENGKDTWAKIDTTGNSTWELATPRYRFIRGAVSGTRAWTTAADTSYRNSDLSYLLSPCFDFSSLTADPRMNFALNFHTEARADGAWLEGSTDGGQSWFKIGKRNSGLNWYNDTLRNTANEVWTGTTRPGWRLTQHVLNGMAGKRNCRVRFAFRTDNTVNTNFDGVAVDNIAITAGNAVDVALDSLGRVDLSDCGNITDTVLIRIFNLGSTTQSAFTVGYQIDNNAQFTENVTNFNVEAGKSAIYKFQSSANTFLSAGTHTLKVWVKNANDAVSVNDTIFTTFFISPVTRGNFTYNFDNLVPPQYWTGVRAGIARGNHGNTTTNGYLFANIYADTAVVRDPFIGTLDTIITPNAQLFDVTSNKFGPIRADDSLKYDYRFVDEDDPFGGYDLINKDTLKVMVANECDRNFTVIDTIFRSKHTPTNLYRSRAVSLKQFVGKVVKIRFQVTSDINTYTGYFFDLDNINYKSVCPAGFGLTATIKNASRGFNDGRIIVKNTSGTAPFTYRWSNNANAKDTLANLGAGDYTVTVTDNIGCTDVQTFTVQIFTSVLEPNSSISKVTLMPNPTSGYTTLDLELKKITDARIQVINLMGQVLYEDQRRQVDKARFEFDMSNKPSGVYFIRITADNRAYTTRLVKQ